jgi:transcriptional regulator with XRE-family HTH domain
MGRKKKLPPEAVTLRQWRYDNGWTQLELAEQLGISQGHVSHLEAGTRRIGFRLALVAEEWLDIPREDLRPDFWPPEKSWRGRKEKK